jgi:ATP-dependent Lhr-like helicase
MELSGEVVGGRFFDGVPGVQFASPAALRTLREGLPQDVVYWMSALDPASPAGLPLDAARGRWPRRAAGNQLVFHGARLVLAIEAKGRRLDFAVAPDHPDLPGYLAPLAIALTRAASPRRSILVQSINGEPAATSPYAARLAERFVATAGAGDSLRLWRRF